MARAIRWQVPFKSLAGIDCRVDIYQNDWEGGITVLSADNADAPGLPAADPFEYEEDDSEDVLNDVIRFRTGYLNLVEKEYGALNDIYPAVNTDRYIEFFYGETLDFVGYIQAQAFENGWEPGPRIIKMPIISPIGLAQGTTFDWTTYNPPRWITLDSAISACLNALNGGYTRYIFPQIISSALGKVLNDLYVNSLLLCPWGKKYYKGSSDLAGIYGSATVEDVLTMICTTFGLVLHDAPVIPVFQRLDWSGNYMSRAVAGASNTLVEPQETDLKAIAEVVSADNTESTILPYSRIEISQDGDKPEVTMSFDTCRAYLAGCALVDYSAAYNTPNIADFSGTFGTLSINSDGQIDKGKVCLAAFGKGGFSESIMFRSNNWQNRTLIATLTIYDWIGESCNLSFRHSWGESLADMKSEAYADKYPPVGIVVKTGNYYYNRTNLWQPIPSGYSGYTRSWPNGEKECKIGITPFYLANPQPLVIEIYASSDQWLWFEYVDDWVQTISDLKLEPYEDGAREYINKNRDENEVVVGSPSTEEGSVDRGLALVSQTTHCMRMSTNITGADENEVRNYPQYPHLLTAQKRLQIDLYGGDLTNIELYTNRFELWGSTDKWKVIARSFRSWDDVYRLTLHSSEVFDE